MAGNPRDFVDVPLERYDSTESEESEKEFEFDRVPTTAEYILRIDEGGKRRQLVTKLKEGRELPYSKNVGGHNFVFNRDLTVDIPDGNWIRSKENDKTWSFVSLSNLAGSESFTEACYSPPGESASSANPPDTMYISLDDVIGVSASGNDYICKICNVTGPNEESEMHLEAVHNIKMNSQGSSTAISSIGDREESISSASTIRASSHSDNASEIINSGVPVSSANSHLSLAAISDNRVMVPDSSLQDTNPPSSSSAERGNIHLNKNWKKELVSSFKEEIVPGWRRDTREAWRDNRSFKAENRKLFIQIRAEITKGLVDHMWTFFGRVCDPTLKQIREIINDLLVSSYPWMFSHGDNSACKIPELNQGKGCGGVQGIDGLAVQLWDTFFRKKSEILKAECGILAEKGKHGNTKGVSKDRYWAEPTDEEVAEYDRSRDIEDDVSRETSYQKTRSAMLKKIREETAREAVFEKHRSTVERRINEGGEKILTKVVPGFFNAPEHLKQMFRHLTEVEDLESRIEANLEQELSLMELFLFRNDKKGDDKDKIKELDNITETLYNGDKTWKWINIIRMLVTKLDKDPKALILLPGESEVTSQAYLKAVIFENNSIQFELHGDCQRLLKHQPLNLALASYYQLAFVFQLRYPEKCHTVSYLIQERIAKYGSIESNVDLTRYGKPLTTAKNKRKQYLKVIGTAAEDD